MKKCVLGDGYIGSAYKNAGYDCIDRSKFVYFAGIDCWTTHNRFENIFSPYDIIINCIGITDTKWTEVPENCSKTFNTNANLVRDLSQYCKRRDKKLVHISTGDLYGNSFQWEDNIEESKKLDANTNYRLSKLAGERFCNSNDLILRIRLPFDARNHPKNLLVKAQNYTKFYRWLNCYTYVPDLINATEILLENKQSGIFNVVQQQTSALWYLMQRINYSESIKNIDIFNDKVANVIQTLDVVHIHNDMNIGKLLLFYQPMHLDEAWTKSWETLQNELTVVNNSVS